MMTRLAIVVLLACLTGPALAGESPKPTSIAAQAIIEGNNGASSSIEPPPAQAAAAPAKAANPSKVIADILAVSGMKKALENMPVEFVASVHSHLEGMQDDKGMRMQPGIQQAIEDSAKAAFTADRFMGRVTRAMKKDYNEKNYQELLADLSSPLAFRMAELEAKADPTPQMFNQFVNDLESSPLPAQRLALLRRLDAASRTSEFMYTELLLVNRGLVRGANGSGRCISNEEMKKAEAKMEGRTKAAKSTLDEMAINILAYTYRDVSDADLSEYLGIYEKANSRHIHDVIFNAVLEEYSDASMHMGHGIMESVKQKRADLGMPACAGSGDMQVAAADAPQEMEAPSQGASAVPPAAPAASEPQAAPVTPKSSIPLEKRQGGDITQCLEAGSKSDKDIAACAEKYRKAK